MGGTSIRKNSFFGAVAAAVAIFAVIFVLTEQNPGETTALSTTVNEAIVSQPVVDDGAGASSVPPGASGSEGDPGLVGAMLAVANARKWAHTAEFFALGVPVSLAAVLWWGRIRGMRARVLAAAGVCALASLFDQTHKIFVPGREFDAGDLLFDFAGYALAMLLVFGGAMTAALAINRLRKHNGAH